MKKGNNKHSKKAVAQRKSTLPQATEEEAMLDDYSFLDWRKAERGKYAKRYAEGTNVVLIEPDLADVFPNADSANRALRALADIIRASAPKAKHRKRAGEPGEGKAERIGS
jgi:hypothetical protein